MMTSLDFCTSYWTTLTLAAATEKITTGTPQFLVSFPLSANNVGELPPLMARVFYVCRKRQLVCSLSLTASFFFLLALPIGTNKRCERTDSDTILYGVRAVWIPKPSCIFSSSSSFGGIRWLVSQFEILWLLLLLLIVVVLLSCMIPNCYIQFDPIRFPAFFQLTDQFH